MKSGTSASGADGSISMDSASQVGVQAGGALTVESATNVVRLQAGSDLDATANDKLRLASQGNVAMSAYGDGGLTLSTAEAQEGDIQIRGAAGSSVSVSSGVKGLVSLASQGGTLSLSTDAPEGEPVRNGDIVLSAGEMTTNASAVGITTSSEQGITLETASADDTAAGS